MILVGAFSPWTSRWIIFRYLDCKRIEQQGLLYAFLIYVNFVLVAKESDLMLEFDYLLTMGRDERFQLRA